MTTTYTPMIDAIADEVITDDDYTIPMTLDEWHMDLSDYCHPSTEEYSKLLARRLHSALDSINEDTAKLEQAIGRSIIENAIAAGLTAKHLERI